MECLLVFRWRASSLSRSTDWRRKCIDSICHVSKHDMHGNQLAPRCFWITKWTNKGPKCNCAAATTTWLVISVVIVFHWGLLWGAPFPALSRALTGEAAWGHFVSFQFGFVSHCRAVSVWTVGIAGRGHIDPCGGGSQAEGVSWCYGLGRSQGEPVYAPRVTWRLGRVREEYRAKSTNMSKCCLHYR